jgi:hypothetical protein
MRKTEEGRTYTDSENPEIPIRLPGLMREIYLLVVKTAKIIP